MKKRIVPLLLCIVMVFTMTVPSFAATKTVNASRDLKKISYCALGDSIPAGCKMYQEDADYLEYKNGIKGNDGQIVDMSFSVTAVERSYVTKFAKAIRADEKSSFNGSYPGMTAEDLCQILGVRTDEKDGPYNKGIFLGQTAGYFLLGVNGHGEYVKGRYTEGIKNADVITITLGENEFSNFFMASGKLSILIKAIGDAIGRIADKSQYTEVARELTNIKSTLESDDSDMKSLTFSYAELSALCKKYASILADIAKALNDTIVDSAKDFRHYWNLLMSTINTLNPDATVIVTTLPNPFSGPDELDKWMIQALAMMTSATLKVEMPEGLENISIKKICQPFTTDMNLYIASVAKKYNYTIADISDIYLTNLPGIDKVVYLSEYKNADKTERDQVAFEKWGGENLNTYEDVEKVAYADYDEWTMMHPSDADHTKIAQIIMKEYSKALVTKAAEKIADTVQKARESVCRDHSKTVIKNKVSATLLKEGYTGDVCCARCGKVITKGEITPRQTLKSYVGSLLSKLKEQLK